MVNFGCLFVVYCCLMSELHPSSYSMSSNLMSLVPLGDQVAGTVTGYPTVCLLLYVQATSTLTHIRAGIEIRDTTHSWRLYSAAPLGNKVISTMTWYPIQSNYPDTEPTSPSPTLKMPRTWLGSDKYQFVRHFSLKGRWTLSAFGHPIWSGTEIPHTACTSANYTSSPTPPGALVLNHVAQNFRFSLQRIPTFRSISWPPPPHTLEYRDSSSSHPCINIPRNYCLLS